MVSTETPAATNQQSSDDIVGTLKKFVIERSLPLWSGEGWDAVAGGFVDRLGPDGRADRQAPRRVFVQARQIYCFAKAAQMGWYGQGRAIALEGLEHHAAARGLSLPTMALAWALTDPAVTGLVLGPRSPEQLTLMSAALDVSLTPSDRAEIARIAAG